jgi:hypothetical protein
MFDPNDEGRYQRLCDSISFRGVAAAPEEKWMTTPEAGFLIAQRFGYVFHTLDIRGSDTVFPLFLGPSASLPPILTVAVLFVDRHYVNITLEGSYPMPPPNRVWSAFRNDGGAEWETMFENQINMYKELVFPKRDPNQSPEILDLD